MKNCASFEEDVHVCQLVAVRFPVQHFDERPRTQVIMAVKIVPERLLKNQKSKTDIEYFSATFTARQR